MDRYNTHGDLMRHMAQRPQDTADDIRAVRNATRRGFLLEAYCRIVFIATGIRCFDVKSAEPLTLRGLYNEPISSSGDNGIDYIVYRDGKYILGQSKYDHKRITKKVLEKIHRPGMNEALIVSADEPDDGRISLVAGDVGIQQVYICTLDNAEAVWRRDWLGVIPQVTRLLTEGARA